MYTHAHTTICVSLIHTGASMLEALAQPFDRNKSHPAALEKQRFALSPMQVCACSAGWRCVFVLATQVLHLC